MEYRLRIYDVKPGEMAAWIDEWSRLIRPLASTRQLEVKPVG